MMHKDINGMCEGPCLNFLKRCLEFLAGFPSAIPPGKNHYAIDEAGSCRVFGFVVAVQEICVVEEVEYWR